MYIVFFCLDMRLIPKLKSLIQMGKVLFRMLQGYDVSDERLFTVLVSGNQ